MVLRHIALDGTPFFGDARVRCNVPERGMFQTQSQNSSRPRVSPARFQRPCAPAEVAGTGPRFPSSEIEGAKPGSMQKRSCFGADLNAAKIFRQFVLSRLDARVARGRDRFMEREQGESGDVKLIAHWIAVLLQ